ncbi:MAG: DNA repair protein RecO [Acidobacteriota bacterium]|nr:MAG: DNA repair protein RecO [Acidobacteriota bacterium]
MPLRETDAFVLRTYTLREADKVCIFFTREAGKIRGVAHGARRLRSRYGASLEIFTEVSLSYFEKENRDLVSISSCEIIRSRFFEGMSSEVLGVMHYFAELVIEFFPEHEPNEKVYRLIGAALDALEGAGELTALVRYFEIWVLKLSGFFPDWRRCGLCGRELTAEPSIWLTNEGMPQCTGCSGRAGEELRTAEWRMIQEILTRAPAEFLATPRAGHPLRQIGMVATRLISRVLERELKSYEVLDRLKPYTLRQGDKKKR